MKVTRAFLSGLAMMVFLVASPCVYAGPTPTETVENAVASVLGILNDPFYKQHGMSEARRGAIEQVVRKFVSDHDMMRYTLGNTWTELLEPDRNHFRSIFIHLLRDAVTCRISDYANAEIVYLGERLEGNTADVRILFKGDKVDTSIKVRLVSRSGDWLMYDAVVDGVSLLENYRSQFEQVMRATSYVGLVSTMEARSRLQKTFEHTFESDSLSRASLR